MILQITAIIFLIMTIRCPDGAYPNGRRFGSPMRALTNLGTTATLLCRKLVYGRLLKRFLASIVALIACPKSGGRSVREMSTRKGRPTRRFAGQHPNPTKTAAGAPENKQDSSASPGHQSTLPGDHKHHPESDKRDRMPNKDEKHWLEYATGFFAFIAAIGGIAAASFGGWQAYIAADAEHKSLRAYVVPLGFRVDNFSVDQPFLSTATFVNAGQTPAKDIRLPDLHFDELPYPIVGTISPKGSVGGESRGDRQAVGKDEKITFIARTYSSIPKSIVDQAALGTVRRMIAWGTLTYTDVFNKEWSTQFCYLIGPREGDQ
jgi:hypothetical protein